MTADNRVVLDYTNRDYKAIRSMLVGLAQGFLPEWATVGETGDFGTLLLELFAYNGDILNYYIDRVGAEAFLGTATRRQSVMFIADMLGYTPIGQQAATVPLSFTWLWDSASTQVATVTYRALRVKVENGTLTVEATNPDTAVEIEVGQAVTLSEAGFNLLAGTYLVTSTTAATDSTPFTFTVDLPDQTQIQDAPWSYVGTGGVITTGSIILIPKKTIISSVPDALGQSVTFELDEDVVLDSHSATQVPTPGFIGSSDPSTLFSVVSTGTATEGVTVDPVSIGISKGVPNSDLVLSDIGVIDNSVKVYTKEGGAAVVWSRIDNLAVAGPDQSVFSYYVDDTGQTHILFGDNASGRIPPVNSEIFVSYRVGVGAHANDLDIGSVTNLSNDFASGAGVTVSNTAAPTGGSDVESIESMRFSIPRSNAVRRRAVSLDDYVSLALQVPGVTKALAYGDSYTSVFLRIAAGAQSRDYITDVTPFIKTGNNVVKVVTSTDHANELHPGDTVYLSTLLVTGSHKVSKVWQGQPTNQIGVIKKKMDTLTHADYPAIAGVQSSATLTCDRPHGLVPGQPFLVTGLDNNSDPDGTPKFDGIWIVGSVPDDERKTLTYHCPKFEQASPDVDATIVDYISPATPVASTTIATGQASLCAWSGLELEAPGIATHLYRRTAISNPSATPNLSFSDPQMKALVLSVEDYLSDKEVVGARVFAEPVEWTNIKVGINVAVRDLYNRTSVKEAVKLAVKNLFAYDNVDFGQTITMGEVYRAALAVDGVEFIDLTALWISDPTITVTEGVGSDGNPLDPGIVTPAVPGIRDIITPPRNVPRLDPAMVTEDTWVTATGGLVNT